MNKFEFFFPQGPLRQFQLTLTKLSIVKGIQNKGVFFILKGHDAKKSERNNLTQEQFQQNSTKSIPR